MSSLSKSLLLFFLNWLDAQLTVVWIKSNVATEGNGLMAALLDQGVVPFMLVKLGVGAFAAYVLYRFAHLTVARRGIQIALSVYCALMFVHLATAMSAFGWHGPEMVVTFMHSLPSKFLAMI